MTAPLKKGRAALCTMLIRVYRAKVRGILTDLRFLVLTLQNAEQWLAKNQWDD